MRLEVNVREEFDASFPVQIDSNQRITVPQLGSRFAGIPGVYLWLRTDEYCTEIYGGYIGESGNLQDRIEDYLTPNPTSTAHRIAQEMLTWQAQYGNPAVTLAVMHDPGAALFVIDGAPRRRWNPAQVSDRRLVETTHIWIGRQRGYELLNLT